MNWKQLRQGLGFGARDQPSPVQFPVQEELVPGELKVVIHSHSIPAGAGELSCWSYVTQGLGRHKQREAIFTLVRRPDEKPESFPREPMAVFRTLLALAKEGRTVAAGGCTSLAGEGLLGFQGFAYVDPVWAPPGDSASHNCVAMIGLTSDEVATLREFGSTRVLSMLGRAERYYPAPFWTERGRPSRVAMSSIEQSFLSKIPLVSGAGFSVYRERSRVVLRARVGSAGETVKAVRARPADAPVALLTRIDPTADGALVWVPSQTHADTITPPNSQALRVCGSFVLFLPGEQVDGQQLLEDGYLLRLTTETWRLLRNAILVQEDIQSPLFELHWIPAGFEEYLPLPLPSAVTPPPAGTVWNRRIVLLQPSAETGAAIGEEALAAFEKSVEDTVRAHFSPGSARRELRVTVDIQPGGKASYQLATKGAVEEGPLQRLWSELQKLAPPAARKPVGFAVELEV